MSLHEKGFRPVKKFIPSIADVPRIVTVGCSNVAATTVEVV